MINVFVNEYLKIVLKYLIYINILYVVFKFNVLYCKSLL